MLDTLTVVWKELKELLFATNNRSTSLRILAWLGVFGVILPIESRAMWLDTPLPIGIWSWLSIFLGAGVAGGSFARERELHTLETLLATRLPDRAVLLGKIVASVIYSWGVVLITHTLGIVALNITQWHGHILFYKPAVGIGGLLISLLAALLIATAGALISFRSATAMQAQMTLTWVTLVILLPVVVIQFLPSAQSKATELLLSANLWPLITISSLVLAIIDTAALAFTAAKYQRSKLLFE